MKPAPFEYHAPESLGDVTALLAEHGDDAKVLAGGQSLVPMLALRLTRFDHIVDLNRVDELRGVERSNGTLTVRSMTRQARRRARHRRRARRCPLLAQAIPLIGHFQIRNRGTVGGSIAHADPASELPAVALALDAELEVVGPNGTRTRPRRRVLPRHLDHHRRGRRDPQRGALPGVAGPGRLRGRGGRAAQRRLRPHRRRRRGRAQRQGRGRARRRSPSSGWRPLRCGPAPRRPTLNGSLAQRARPHGDRTARGRRHRSDGRRARVGRVPPARRCAPRGARPRPSPGSSTPWLSTPSTFTVNGREHSGRAEGAQDAWPTTSARTAGSPARTSGCEHGVCGACTILVDGAAVRSCLMFAVQAEGADITTIEGIGPADGRLGPVQEAFRQAHGLQCGFCTPGLRRQRARVPGGQPAARASTRSARACPGNLCRCTGYQGIIKAVQIAAESMSVPERHEHASSPPPTARWRSTRRPPTASRGARSSSCRKPSV